MANLKHVKHNIKHIIKATLQITKAPLKLNTQEQIHHLVSEINSNITNFTQETNSALSMFRNTIDDLTRAEEKIADKQIELRNHIEQICILQDKLTDQLSVNSKIKTKLKEFIS